MGTDRCGLSTRDLEANIELRHATLSQAEPAILLFEVKDGIENELHQRQTRQGASTTWRKETDWGPRAFLYSQKLELSWQTFLILPLCLQREHNKAEMLHVMIIMMTDFPPKKINTPGSLNCHFKLICVSHYEKCLCI